MRHRQVDSVFNLENMAVHDLSLWMRFKYHEYAVSSAAGVEPPGSRGTLGTMSQNVLGVMYSPLLCAPASPATSLAFSAAVNSRRNLCALHSARAFSSALPVSTL